MQRGRIRSSPTKIVRLGLLKVKADLESELGTLP